MFKAPPTPLVLLIACLALSGCTLLPRRAPAPPPPVPQTQPLALTPWTSSTLVVRDPVRIDPEQAVGYAQLPSTVTQLFDRPPLRLTLEEVVEQTLAHNRSIRIQGYSLRIAQYGVPLSRGIYDLFLSANAAFRRTERQAGQSDAITVNRSRTKTGQAALSQLLPTGAVASATWAVTQSAQDNYSNRTVLQLRQPLLQGFGPAVTNAGIVLAILESQASRADYETLLADQVQLALETYWQLIGVIEAYQVEVIAYAAAADLLRANQERFRVGLLAISGLMQTEATLADRYDRLLRARQAVRNLEDRLKRILFLAEGEPLWAAQIMPAQPVVWRQIAIDPDRAVLEAQALRPELERARSNLEQAAVRQRVARNDVLPVLDAIGHLLPRGVGSGFDEALWNQELSSRTSYEVALEFAYPLQNRAARYRLKQAQARLEQAAERLADTRDRVTLEVRLAAREYETARRRIDAALARIRSEQANLETEMLRLGVGLSTTFRVLSFQQDLATAQLQYVQAVVDANLALIRLERARGTLLASFRVKALLD